MKNSLTSRYKKRQDIKYYSDVNIETKRWEVIELPSNHVIKTYTFEEDASSLVRTLNKNKPFGDNQIPRFLVEG